MAHKFKQLRQSMSPESQDRARVKAQAMYKQLMLAEVRQAHSLSQQDLAKTMNLKQPAISKIEKSTDLYLSTLRRYIEAMGGQLEIIARFDDGEIYIKQFEELRKKVAY